MPTQLLQVDVFSPHLLGGNPLAVFVNPPDVPAERFQAWAREMNLSETTFAWVENEHRYRSRIFTPQHELPFAGHPTLGTVAALSQMGLVHSPVTQVTEAGESLCTQDAQGMWWMVPPPGRLGPAVSPETAAEALGIGAESVRGEHPPRIVSAGLAHLLVNVEPSAVERLSPSFSHMQTVLAGLKEPVGGVYAWAFAGAGSIHARMFAPGHGVNEDAATGSAAADLAWYLVYGAGVTDPSHFVIRQGAEMGRPSELHLHLNVDGMGIAVGGAVVPVFSAEIPRFSD
ncbi:MAG: PhzF family phenazine biosynthesis protein [Clostridia bacterium]